MHVFIDTFKTVKIHNAKFGETCFMLQAYQTIWKYSTKSESGLTTIYGRKSTSFF